MDRDRRLGRRSDGEVRGTTATTAANQRERDIFRTLSHSVEVGIDVHTNLTLGSRGSSPLS